MMKEQWEMVTKDGSERGTEETKSRTEEEDENDNRRKGTKDKAQDFFPATGIAEDE